VGVGAGDAHFSVEEMARAAGFVALRPDAGVVVQNADGEIVAASQEAQQILGLSFDQMLGRTSQDPRWASVDADGRFLEGAESPAMVARRTRTAVRNRIMGVHRPGSDAAGRHVWLYVDAVPVFSDGDPEPWAVVAAFRPVSDDLLQALELRESERLFRMIAEHSSDMVAWQLVDETTFLWVSPASRTVLGFEPDALIGTYGIDLVHPDDRARLVESWQRTSGAVTSFTMRMRHADGQFRWIETTAHVLPADGDRPLQMITAHRDVSDRVKAERARDTAVRMFELAMRHATIGVAWRRRDGTLSRVNPALCRILGREPDELVGHSLKEFATGDSSDFEGAIAAVEAGVLSHHEVERQFRRPDGTVAWCLHTVIGLPDESGEVSYFLVQLQDITEQKNAAAQLEQAALTDPLTGLPNRTVLEDRLTRALARARQTNTLVGVLFIDLDHFKVVNDSYGHDVGDQVLREIGIRLATAVRDTDTVVRLGGDEFVVVREHLSDFGQLEDLAETIDRSLAAPYLINSRTLEISASIGSAGGAELTAGQLLSRADESMYRAKRGRRDSADKRFRGDSGGVRVTHDR
jgi:diguanylate cyclase (GGDEF)-like protein/PAS domain S-box-containing protein